jgi:hypothetical protein
VEKWRLFGWNGLHNAFFNVVKRQNSAYFLKIKEIFNNKRRSGAYYFYSLT